jgi:hypothetical protein
VVQQCGCQKGRRFLRERAVGHSIESRRADRSRRLPNS